jgi:hypothetical protein
MSNTIRIRRRAAGGASGAPSTLQNAELAFNEQDDVLYYGKGTGGANGTATQVIAIGGPGAFQPKDGDLDAIAALTGTGLVRRTGDSTYSLDTATYLTSISSGDVTTALGFTPENSANKGQANGYASLDSGGKVPSSQLPSFVDDVEEYTNLAAFPATGEAGKIYVALDTNKVYRWGGSAYVEISASPGSTDAVAEGSVNLYFTEARARNSISATGSLSYDAATGVISFTDAVTSVAGKTGAVTLDKADVGLGNVENTALSTWAGSTNLTTLGTITTGTWNGSTIAVSRGGTGVTTLTGLVKGNGTSAFSAAVAGTDYLDPNSTIDGGTF